MSTTRVSTFSSRSRASALRIRTPTDGASTGADHDGHGRGQTQGARAGDDEDRDGVHEGMRQARLGTDQGPDNEGQYGDGDDGGHEPAGDAVRQPLDGGAAALRLADHLHDLREHGLAANALGAHDE